MSNIKWIICAGIFTLSASHAAAWGDMYMGDGTHNPNSMPVQAYHGPNYCPAGLAPVVVGGVICCGTPSRPAMMHMPYKHSSESYGYVHHITPYGH